MNQTEFNIRANVSSLNQTNRKRIEGHRVKRGIISVVMVMLGVFAAGSAQAEPVATLPAQHISCDSEHTGVVLSQDLTRALVINKRHGYSQIKAITDVIWTGGRLQNLILQIEDLTPLHYFFSVRNFPEASHGVISASLARDAGYGVHVLEEYQCQGTSVF